MQKFPYIDALRAIAALGVLCFHVIAIGEWDFPHSGPLSILRYGGFGVQLFLVISGFVICYSGLARFRQTPEAFYRDYAKQRFLRIAPLYVLTGVVFLAVADVGIRQLPWDKQAFHYVTHLLFIHNWFAETHGSINGPNWTVALEMQFYLFMMFVIPRMLAWRMKLVVALIGIAWLTKLALTHVYPPSSNSMHDLFLSTTQLPGALDLFAIGIWLAIYAVGAGNASNPPPRFFSPSVKNSLAWLAVSALALVAAAAFYQSESSYWTSRLLLLFFNTTIGVVFGSLLAAAISAPGSTPIVMRPVLYLGRISYGIYLWHLPVILVALRWWELRGISLLAATLVCAIGLAALSWHLFERPIMDRFGRTPA